jgi:hypothetical protein
VQEYKKQLSKDLYLKNGSMKTLGQIKTGSSQSLLDIPRSDQNSPKHEQRAQLMKISETLENCAESKNRLKEGHEECADEIKNKKRIKRRKMLRKSSLEPLKSDRSHKEVSSKHSKLSKLSNLSNLSKRKNKHDQKIEISQVPAGSPAHPATLTFESYNSKLDSASPSSSRSPSES